MNHLSDSCVLCDLSRFQLSRIFGKEQGLTFRDFVVRLRMFECAHIQHTCQRPSTENASSTLPGVCPAKM
jgi:AraC-like DNA-binding protein